MNDILNAFVHYLPQGMGRLAWRTYPLDEKLLLFDRNTGLNVLLQGEETKHFRRIAPRTLLIAVTNSCNLACAFCYRDLQSRSLWHYENLLEFCQGADAWGVLEVAFGGGEPLLLPRWQEFICQLYKTTKLGVNFTTNGTLLTEDFLRGIAGHYGQIRVSLYKNNNWLDTVALLARCQARFGVNWLITPEELETIETKFWQLLALGTRDFLFLSYKGNHFPKMHCTDADCHRLSDFVDRVQTRLGTTIQLKMDICWGDHLPMIPRLFSSNDCGAGDDFLSIMSDQRVKPCSFHQSTIAFDTIDDVKEIWHQQRKHHLAALLGGCARLPNRGFTKGGFTQNADIHLATI